MGLIKCLQPPFRGIKGEVIIKVKEFKKTQDKLK
jgi:hypothetical protein